MVFDKGRGKLLKTRAFIFLTAVVIALSSITLVFSVNMTSIMLRKQDQLAAARPDASASLKKNNSGIVGAMNLKKSGRWPLFFNGRLQDGLICYASGNGKFLMPIDIILNNLKAGYGILNSDDAFKADINGKELLLHLGTRNAKLGDSAVELDTASVAAENHIMASPMILDSLDDIRFYNDVADEAVFTNYWPSSKDEKYSGIGLFKIDGRTLEISDIFGSMLYSYDANGPATMDEAVYSRSLDSLLVKSGEEYYIINKKNYKNPPKLDIKGTYNLSSDGGFLYRVDNSGKYFLIYDVKSSSLKKLKNHYSSIRLINGASLTDCRLLAQQAGSLFVRLDFEAPGGGTYSAIARGGRVVAQGSSKYSPDHARLLLYDRTEGWSLCGSDGRGIVRFKDVTAANWVDNDRILLRKADGLEVYERKNGSRHKVEVPFYHIGQADDGRCFYSRGNELYQTIKGSETKIGDFPWRCEYACSVGEKSPVVLVSREANNVFIISEGTVISLGKPELFPNLAAPDAVDAGFNDNAVFSTDGGRLALLQKGEKFLEISLLQSKDLKQDKITLDFTPDSQNGNSKVFMKWLGNDSLLLYTANRGWLVDFGNNDTYIHEWTDNAAIAGIFQLPQ